MTAAAFDLDRFILRNHRRLVLHERTVNGEARAEEVVREVLLRMQTTEGRFRTDVHARAWYQVAAAEVAREPPQPIVDRMAGLIDRPMRDALIMRAEGYDDDTIGARLGIEPRLVPGLLRIARSAVAPLRVDVSG